MEASALSHFRRQRLFYLSQCQLVLGLSVGSPEKGSYRMTFARSLKPTGTIVEVLIVYNVSMRLTRIAEAVQKLT
jgi:hypothetical protein